MSDGGDPGRGGGSLEDMLQQLVEAQTNQTLLMAELVNVSKSLATSESTESIAELITAAAESTKIEMLAALVDSGQPMATAAAPPQAQQPVLSNEELAVLGGYDELRAALGRTDAKAFYVAATADRTDYTLTIVGDAVMKADTVTVGDKSFTISNPLSGKKVINDPPDEVFSTPQPKVRLLAGGRVIAVARFITVKKSSTTTGLRG
jgi:hypothetical protein